MLDKIGQKFVTKHAKRAVSFRLKNNETCKTACFASMRNFAKQQVCFAKLVLLETLCTINKTCLTQRDSFID
jgi:hypothetical protein